MSRESLILGIGTALIGAVGLWHREWLLAETPKGRFLVESLGATQARRLIAGFCLVLVSVGISLATGWLKPIRW